jgi:hypothetical protein
VPPRSPPPRPLPQVPQDLRRLQAGVRVLEAGAAGSQAHAGRHCGHAEHQRARAGGQACGCEGVRLHYPGRVPVLCMLLPGAEQDAGHRRSVAGCVVRMCPSWPLFCAACVSCPAGEPVFHAPCMFTLGMCLPRVCSHCVCDRCTVRSLPVCSLRVSPVLACAIAACVLSACVPCVGLCVRPSRPCRCSCFSGRTCCTSGASLSFPPPACLTVSISVCRSWRRAWR